MNPKTKISAVNNLLDAELNATVDRFESSWKASESINIEDFLPSSKSKHFRAILCELIRVDLELRW